MTTRYFKQLVLLICLLTTTNVHASSVAQDEMTISLIKSVEASANAQVYFNESKSIKYTRYTGLAVNKILAATSESAMRGSGDYGYSSYELCTLLGHQYHDGFTSHAMGFDNNLVGIEAGQEISKIVLDRPTQVISVAKDESKDTAFRREKISYLGGLVDGVLGPLVTSDAKFGQHSSWTSVQKYNQKVDEVNKGHAPAVYQTMVYESIFCADKM